MDLKNAAMLLAALAQESRLKIYKTVADAGSKGLPAGVISLCTDTKPSVTSFHLKELSRAQLVRRKQAGRNVIYAAQHQPLGEVLSLLARCSPPDFEHSRPAS
ncbi:helix-turn-helix transcriptional regulator [Xylophilus sp. GW821-FHT01B05]